MKRLRQHPFFAVTLLTLMLVMLLEAWGIGALHSTAHSARRRLDRAGKEWRSISARDPSPTPENATLITTDLEHGWQVLAEYRAKLGGTGPTGGYPPFDRTLAGRSAAFFDVAAFVEEMRDLAQRHGVKLKPDERFGFSAYVNDAPESERMAQVFRDRVIVQSLLEALFEAHPHELLFVQREQPRKESGLRSLGAAGGSKAAPTGGTDARDYFIVDQRVSIRNLGADGTRGYRLSFTGSTEVLRTLVNTVADWDRPVLVRMIEVSQVDQPRAGATAMKSPGAGVAWLVSQPRSRFTVVLEAIDPELFSPAAG